jgi:peptidoglycan/LPS O-acetylase OafA/YrhL
VFLSHYAIEGKPVFYEGYIGVEFFFILSGFIISYKYAQRITDKTISIKKFLVARIARIYPLHGITFLLVALLGLRRTLRTGTPFPLFQMLFNIVLLQSFVPDKSYYFSFNAVSWSISNELFFYALFPVLIYGFENFQKKVLALLCIIILVCYFIMIAIVPENYAHALFYISPCLRVIDFMIGISIFHLWKKIQSNEAKSGIYVFLRKGSVATIIEILTSGLLILMVFISDNVPQGFRYASYYWIPISLTILCFAKTSPGGGGGGGIN